MTDKIAPVFVDNPSRLPLLNDHGRAFVGLQNSSSPELVERVKCLFEYLNERLGFSDSTEGKENQKLPYKNSVEGRNRLRIFSPTQSSHFLSVFSCRISIG